MKIPLTILTYKRPAYLDRTLGSFLDLNAGILDRFSLRVLIQGGSDPRTAEVIEAYRRHIDSVHVLADNVGIGRGWSALMAGVIGKCRYVLHLEDDWESRESLAPYLREILGYMDRTPDVGQIRLRHAADKTCAKNPFRGVEIAWAEPEGNIVRGNAHFVFNPAITRSSVLPAIAPCTSEKEACIRYEQLKLDCAQLMAGCFVHIGEARAYTWKNGEKRYMR